MDDRHSESLESPEDSLVLLVGNVPADIKALSEILKPVTPRLIKASSGNQALTIAQKERPDLIVLDESLSGPGLLHALKENAVTQALPVLLLIDRNETAHLEAGFNAGVDCIGKPVNATELCFRVRTQLELQQRREREKKLLADLQAASTEVKLLSGLVPICAHCKKIRNDDGFWQQVDQYVSRRSAIQFSHGLCPDCAPIYFPDFKPAASKPQEDMAEKTKREKILVVDDSPESLQILTQFLQENYDVLAANEGPAALELALHEQPSLILLDVLMPDMDGHEVCMKLKDDPRTHNIPVIFVTAESEEGCELKGFDMGAVDYITKPFSLSILHARIETHLELKRFRDDLERQSMTDGLTGIPNRRYLDRFLELFWHQAVRLRIPISLIQMNVDFFKTYNDQYGHLAGDDCLKKVVQALEQTIHRKSDFLARSGGEEFMCVLLGTDKDGAVQVAERLRQSVQALAIPHVESYVATHVTISLGIAASQPKPDDKLEPLLAKAEQALEEAKKRGRNRCFALQM